MKRKKSGVPRVHVGEDGAFECPECGGLNYLDSYDYGMLVTNRIIPHHCPMCETPLKLSVYEQDSYPEL
jgi:rubrerythrin